MATIAVAEVMKMKSRSRENGDGAAIFGRARSGGREYLVYSENRRDGAMRIRSRVALFMPWYLFVSAMASLFSMVLGVRH